MDKEAIKTFRHNMKDDKQRKEFFKAIRNSIRCASCKHLKTCSLRYSRKQIWCRKKITKN